MKVKYLRRLLSVWDGEADVAVIHGYPEDEHPLQPRRFILLDVTGPDDDCSRDVPADSRICFIVADKEPIPSNKEIENFVKEVIERIESM